MPVPASRRPASVVVLLAALLSGLLLAPTASFAAEGSGATASDLVLREEALAPLPEVSTGAPGQAEEPFPVTAATPVSATCPDLLVTLTPERPGDGAIVVFTAQSIDLDLGGWVNVTWEPAPGAAIREVLAIGIDGSVTALPGGEGGTTLDARSLSFCGTFDPPAAPSEPEPEPAPEPAPTPVPAPAPAPAAPSSGGGSAPDQGGSSATSTSGSPSATPPASTDTDTPTDAPATTPDDAQDPRADDLEEPVGDAEATPAQPETEVLGVQMTREQDGAPWWAWAIAVSLFSLLVTGGYLVSRQP